MLNRIGTITRATANEVVAPIGALRLMGFRRDQRGAHAVPHPAVIAWILVFAMGVLGAGTGWAQDGNGSIVGWGAHVVGVDLSAGFGGVAAGGYHSLGLKLDGSIVAWGWNDGGQCDVPAPLVLRGSRGHRVRGWRFVGPEADAARRCCKTAVPKAGATESASRCAGRSATWEQDVARWAVFA